LLRAPALFRNFTSTHGYILIKKLDILVLAICAFGIAQAAQAKEQATVTLGGMSWFHSNREHQVGSNRLAGGNWEYLHVGTLPIPIGINFFISRRSWPAPQGYDELNSFSLVSGYQLQSKWFEATALAGLGWAKGKDVAYVIPSDGSFSYQEDNKFSTFDVPLILRGAVLKKWTRFSLGAGPEISIHLNSQNIPASFGLIVTFGYE
jgi:hypothetical protein